MKKLLRAFLIVSVFSAGLYLAGAFVAFDLNPNNWHLLGRLCTAIVFGISVAVIIEKQAKK